MRPAHFLAGSENVLPVLKVKFRFDLSVRSITINSGKSTGGPQYLTYLAFVEASNSMADIEKALLTGKTPDLDSLGSGMFDVVGGTSQLTQEDRHAIAVYLKSLPPLRATGK